MSEEVYAHPPAIFKTYRKIFCPNLPTECYCCKKPVEVLSTPWWVVCHECQRVFVIHPRYCWQFKGWDARKCCNSCHGFNQHFTELTRVYAMKDGRIVDVCCTLARWLKDQGFIEPSDPGIGDDELFHTYHK